MTARDVDDAEPPGSPPEEHLRILLQDLVRDLDALLLLVGAEAYLLSSALHQRVSDVDEVHLVAVVDCDEQSWAIPVLGQTSAHLTPDLHP